MSRLATLPVTKLLTVSQPLGLHLLLSVDQLNKLIHRSKMMQKMKKRKMTTRSSMLINQVVLVLPEPLLLVVHNLLQETMMIGQFYHLMSIPFQNILDI
jgi:hypothetical protein